MEVRDVSGVQNLNYAVVTAQNVVVSLHQHPDAAETFRKTCRLGDEFEVVKLISSIGYRQS